ncbi:hypothetical protein B0O80DRAFT_437577 [Mortierella sp. GBAus27b]|nr:hypothetical protein B0O80DRAFT_437577 [Mortierella sp. GBAus27b]
MVRLGYIKMLPLPFLLSFSPSSPQDPQDSQELQDFTRWTLNFPRSTQEQDSPRPTIGSTIYVYQLRQGWGRSFSLPAAGCTRYI